MTSAELQAKLTGRTYVEPKQQKMTSAILQKRIQQHILENNIQKSK